MKYDLDKYLKLAKNKEKANKLFITKLRKKKPKDLDYNVVSAHNKVFNYTDCLKCANCCKTISPIITNKDIERIAKHFKMKPYALIEQYFRLDEDEDYVFTKTPCPFLMPDNYCMIYDIRPKACREYPHTDRNKFYKILNLTYRNSLVCPAVYEVIEELKVIYDK